MTVHPVEFHVNVTWENIRQGEPADTNSCPVALALLQLGRIEYCDTVLQINNVAVGAEVIELWAAGYQFSADVPEDIQYWIDAFDEDNSVDREGFLPVEFDLRFYCTNINEDEEIPF